MASDGPTPARPADWRRATGRDAVVLAVLAVAAAALAARFGVFDVVGRMASRRAPGELGALLVLLPVLSLALVVYAARRVSDLSRQVAGRRLAEARAAALERHDPLTGLPNRRCFVEKLDELFGAARDGGRRHAVFMVDVSESHLLNARHGQRRIDEVLVELAARIGGVLGEGAFVARVGDDVFAVALPDIASLDEPTRLARRLVVAAERPFATGGPALRLGVDIGIAVVPDDGAGAEDVMRRADLALGRAKTDRTSAVRFFDPEMDSYVARRVGLERELAEAVASNAITLHYQPIFAVADERIVGFEALARWKSPTYGWVAPDQFIAVAEECGLVRSLGDQLLQRALADAAQWPPDVRLSVNIADTQLHDRALGLRIVTVLRTAGLRPDRLEIEIDESALQLATQATQDVVRDLRLAGVRTALDGFGNGFGSLAQLLAMRFDTIKIDAGIIHRLDSDAGGAVVVRAAVALAANLGLNVTAKSVETANQLVELRRAGCAEAQGFLLGKAVPAADVPALLRRVRHAAAAAG